jgi:hypothetical protein
VTGNGSTQPTPTANGAREQRDAIERALMDRARARASREHEQPRRLLQYAISLVAVLAIMGVTIFALDAFLAAMQKFMDTKIVDPAPDPKSPMPAFVVPAEVSPPPPADQDPRPSQPPARETSEATP